jgi:hypothetical protein
MINLVSSDDFIVAATAIVSVGIGVFVKIASRNDLHQSFSRNDLAVGLDLLISAIIILVSRAGARSSWGVLFMFLLLWLLSTLVRKTGLQSENHLKLPPGIVIPDIIGLSSLIVIVILT